MFKSKLLWRMAVIILVVAFSAATIVSCGGDTPTQSTSLSTSSGGGTTGGGTGSGDGTGSGGDTNDDGTGSITLPEEAGSVYTVTVPFASASKVAVDYRDSAKLNQLWLDQINRKAAND
ncbi:hypothetical protein, partial [uncultured Brachyspira sp.]|uniref:hypothetical protein n=1 Tax=uncultured Brachyspira sp. TaxID=221953 RepID=UPI0027DB9555